MSSKAASHYHRAPYRAAAWLEIVAGAGVVLLWGWLLYTRQLTYRDSGRYVVLSQLVAQGLMAVWLIVSGVMALSHTPGGRTLSLPALGMLILSAIHYAGYCVQEGMWPWAGALVAVALLGWWGVTAMRSSIRHSSSRG